MLNLLDDMISFKAGYLREIGNEARAEEILDFLEGFGIGHIFYK